MLASPSSQSPDYPGSLYPNAPNPVTPLARPQPAMSTLDVASGPESLPPKECSTTRGYSDSVVPCCWASKDKAENFHDFSDNDLVKHILPTGTRSILPIRVKSRTNLQLPSFKTLGISSRLPDPLFTPPDESIDPSINPPPTFISRSSSYPPTNMPNTPSPDRGEILASSSIVGLSTGVEASSSVQPSTVPIEPQGSREVHGTGSPDSASEDESVEDRRAAWLVEPINAASKLDIPSHIDSRPQ